MLVGPPRGMPPESGNRLGHGSNRCGKPALVAGSLVLVDDVLVRDGIDDAGSTLKHAVGSRLVARFDRFLHAFHCAAQFRAQTRVVLTLLFALPRALSG